jgi:peptide/nickel transport system substrate-binding protein
MMCAAALATLTLAAACGSANGAAVRADRTAVKGGVARWAEPPRSAPDYIFPYESLSYSSIANNDDLTQLLYRPLYWFGDAGQPTLNKSLSLAYPPTFSGDKVTIRLKHYKWSNGTRVTAGDVMFWLHMLEAVPQDWYGYTGFPADVQHITVVSPTELTMVMDKSYSPTWFLYNNLSQITPMPLAWDRTAAGPSDCAAIVRDCAKVYSYLNSQSMAVSHYVTSPLWRVVDGPWRLKSFSPDGRVTFVPNRSYSGPVKPSLAEFQEVPFASTASEYKTLRSPRPGRKIDVGYLPTADAPVRPANHAAGPNPLKADGYFLAPLYSWGINYFVVNFQSTTGNGPVIRQLYFRQALAYLVNQAAVISGPLRGYGAPTVGPVANTPPSVFLSPEGKQGDPFPYSPARAKSLLADHGWNVVPNGTTTCARPSRCGRGIRRGQKLIFNFPYSSASTGDATTVEMTRLRSSAAALGIRLNIELEPTMDVIDEAAGNCVVLKISCKWDMANWAGGWTFAPEYLPTGETLFLSGAFANSGGYSNAKNDALINKTLTSGNLSYLYQWQDYLARQLPVIWQPTGAYSLTEIAHNLKGVTPQSPTLSLTPESWYFVK